MPKPLMRSFFIAIAVLFLLAASSAFGAHRLHSERTRAGAHRASHERKAGRRAKAERREHHKRGPTPTPPVIPPSPLEPVSPVEPTPPITPVLPVEPVTPPVGPTTPVEPTPPTPPVEPAPAPPTASFTFTPASPITGQAVAFDGADSTCPDEPCTYEWSDDGGITRPIPALWPLGSGQNLSFTFAEVGTKYVRLVVTDALGQTASVEHNVVVKEAPMPPPPTEPEPEPEPVSPPTNTAMPAISGTATEGQQLSTTNGTWSGDPSTYAYQWRHCNSSGHSCTNISGATSSKYTLASSDVGHTMRVTVTAANEGGSSSMSSPTTAMVTAPVVTPPPSEPPPSEPPPSEPPPSEPPAAPTNTALPTISGTATEGSALSAAKGSWSGSPTAYAYQWQDCNSSGASCTNVSGATSSSYTLGSSDVSHTIRVLVTASNAGGSTQASSAQSATVTAHAGTQQTGCFSAPGACGYPDPNYGNVGATSPCSSLTASGSVDAKTSGETVQNLNITGDLSIDAANVTVNNVCITDNGGKTDDGIDIADGATNALVEHTTVQSSSPSNESTFMDTGVAASIGACTSGILLNYDVVEGAAESVHAPYDCSSTATGMTVENSYMQAGYFFTRSGEPSHNEDVYLSDSSFTANHDTLLNAQGQTAVLFGDNNGGSCCIAADNHWVVKNSLLAGGGFMAYWNAKSTTVGSSTMDIEDNDWARCTTSPKVAGDGEECNGVDPGAAGWVPFGQSAGADSHGYFPNGGYYPEGLQSGGDLAYGYCPPTAGQIFTNNVWDDNGAAVGC